MSGSNARRVRTWAATLVAVTATATMQANAGDIVRALGPVNISGGILDGNVVFDNSTNLLGFLINDREQERGDSATLAGTDRSVVEISLLIHSNAGDVNADVQVRLYEGGDTGGDPGALLWASGVFPQMTIAAGTNQYDFAVPSILVGNEVTWTVEMRAVTGDPSQAVGPRFVAPPTVGTSMDYLWDHTSGAWVQQRFGSPGMNNYGAIITAVPEPTSLMLMGLGVLVLRRRR